MELSSKLLAESAMIAFPTVFIVAYLYSSWSTKWSVVGSIALTLVGLVGVLWIEFAGAGSPVLPVALLIVGTNGIDRHAPPLRGGKLSSAHPWTHDRDRGGVHQGGRDVAQFLAILALVPPLALVSLIIMAPTLAALGLISRFGKETRGRDLRDLDPDGHTFAAIGL